MIKLIERIINNMTKPRIGDRVIVNDNYYFYTVKGSYGRITRILDLHSVKVVFEFITGGYDCLLQREYNIKIRHLDLLEPRRLKVYPIVKFMESIGAKI